MKASNKLQKIYQEGVFNSAAVVHSSARGKAGLLQEGFDIFAGEFTNLTE